MYNRSYCYQNTNTSLPYVATIWLLPFYADADIPKIPFVSIYKTKREMNRKQRGYKQILVRSYRRNAFKEALVHILIDLFH